MALPSRLVSGQEFKTGVVRKINEIIEYLKTQRLVSDNKTIRLNECAAGITLSAVQDGGGAGKGGNFEHPFKLYLSADDNGSPQISVRKGDVFIQGQTQIGVTVFYEEQPENWQGDTFPEYIICDWSSLSDGDYYVSLCIFQYQDDEDEAITQKGVCLISDANNYNLPCVPGFWSVPLGAVTKTTENTSYGLKVAEQYIVGDLTIKDEYTPFGLRFQMTYTEGAVTETAILKAFLQTGHIYTGDGEFEIKDNNNFSTSTGGTYYAILTPSGVTWSDSIGNIPLNSECLIMASFTLFSNGDIYYQQHFGTDLVFAEGSAALHPFKLFVNSDEETGLPVISMYPGQVYFQTADIVLLDYDNSLIQIDVSQLDEGEYGLIGVCKYDGQYFDPEIIVVESGVTTEDIPCVSGYRIFEIGWFEKTNNSSSGEEQSSGIEEETAPYSLRITEQVTNSNVILEDKYFDLPFCAVCTVDDGSPDEVKTDASDFTIQEVKLSTGYVFDFSNSPQGDYVVNQLEDNAGYTPVSGSNYCYLERTLKGEEQAYNSYQLIWDTEIQEMYEYQQDEFTVQRIPLASVYVNNSLITIQNYHPGHIYFTGGNDHKVLINGEETPGYQAPDPIPGYLHEKLEAGRFENKTQSTWPTSGGVDLPGYLYKQGVETSGGNYLQFRWDYPQIAGFDDPYLQLNAQNKLLKWEPQGTVRLSSSDETAGFFPEKIVGKGVISCYVESSKFNISANVSEFIRELTTSECLSAVKTSSTSSGSVWNIQLDKDCVFKDFQISGTEPINVTGSGQNWNVGFTSSSFIKSISGTNCISAVNNAGAVTVSLDKNCVFQDFSIEGNSPIQVTGSGNNWNIGLNSSGLVKSVTGQNCISASNNAGAVTVSLDKNCVFQDFSIQGGNKISVTGSGRSWQVSYTGSGSGDGKEVTVTGTAPIIVTSTGTSSSSNFNVAINSSGLITEIVGSNCISAVNNNGTVTITLDKDCVFDDFGIDGENGIHVVNTGEQNNRDWIVSLNVSGTGLLFFNSGNLRTISLPSSPSVLVGTAEGVSWIPYSDCTSACN